MGFLTEDVPPRGIALDVVPGIRRIVADNPGVMTYHGTNTYLVEDEGGLVVVDPGPDDEAHIRNILAAAGGTPISLILLTHGHSDHSGALAALIKASGAPVAAYAKPVLAGFTPDIALPDGGEAGGFTALFTPGHAADHLCFQFYGQDGQKILFSGDHVMSWSSSIVSPPEGDMSAYYRALELLLRRDDDVFLPGHGPLLPQPRLLTAALLANRQMRERSILDALREQPRSVAELAARLYHKSELPLKAAAQRNVLAHLLKSKSEGVVLELEPDASLHEDNQALAAMAAGSAVWRLRVARMAEDSKRRFSLPQ